MKGKLKIQIWSDVMCPFCYIGKRKLEEALSIFENKDLVEIEWKSYQLDANFVSKPGDNTIDHLAKKYQKDKAWAQTMVDNVTQNASSVGLDFHFEKAILANSFKAHRLSHLAKKHQRGDVFEELLFKAYLTQGKDVNDNETLTQLALEAGLPAEAINQVLHSNAYAEEVKQDILEAQAIGVQGVPFFVFDNKYAVSGAQPTEVFLKTLVKTWKEGKFDSKINFQNTTDAASCGIDGCE